MKTEKLEYLDKFIAVEERLLEKLKAKISNLKGYAKVQESYLKDLRDIRAEEERAFLEEGLVFYSSSKRDVWCKLSQ